MKKKTMFVSTILALFIICLLAINFNLYNKNKNLIEYTNHNIHNHFIEIGENLKFIHILLERIEENESLKEEEYISLYKSYVDFYYAYADVLILADYIQVFDYSELNHSKLSQIKKELDLNTLSYNQEFSQEQKDFFKEFKRIIILLTQALDDNFKRFALQEFKFINHNEIKYKIVFQDDLKPSFFDNELTLSNKAWKGFLIDVSRINDME